MEHHNSLNFLKRNYLIVKNKLFETDINSPLFLELLTELENYAEKIEKCYTEKLIYDLNRNPLNKVPSLSTIKNELNRYNQQLNSLEQSKDYQEFEEQRTQLRSFYQSKIRELQSDLSKAIGDIEVTAEVIQANQTG
jgi:hypothetical protein